MKRRDFLQSSGWFVVGAALVGIPGCGDNIGAQDPDPELEPAGTYGFPQGVASADPSAGSVVLWTRVVVTSATGAFGAVAVRVQVSTSDSFATLVVDQSLTAASLTDHTVRVLVTGLAPATDYHYRFVAGQDVIAGRTRTAPDPAADVQVNLAWVSCQDYTAGHYGAYRQMLVDDAARPAADQIHAIVHLGDMIYETRADAFQTAIDEQFRPIELTNRDGLPRAIGPFPKGETRAGVTFAQTVDDYRHLYKTFLSDPDIQAARARWPFISIWDDHEFSDDCWQSQANYDLDTDNEGNQRRKLAASQAWFEYVPALLTGAGGVSGVASAAHDFRPAAVDDAAFTAPDASNFVTEPNNAAAIGALTIYRSLRFGKHVELVMTDERSYRSDHALPEDIVAQFQANPQTASVFFTPRNVLPIGLVNALDAGKTFNGDKPLDNIPLIPNVLAVPNVRKASPAGTMLGARQKQWWKDTMKKSNATWKVWGNEVTLARIKITRLGPDDFDDRMLTGDSWDGYAAERNELMGYLRSENIQNVVVLSGDIHAAFAATLKDNFDATTPVSVAHELVGPGVASNSLFSFFEVATRVDPQDPDPAAAAQRRALITVDASAIGGSSHIESLNLLLRHGTTSAGAFAQVLRQTQSIAGALQAANTVSVDPNPHLKYIDTNAQGYGYVKFTGAQASASIVTIKRPIAAPTDQGPGVLRTAQFTIAKDNPDGLSNPTITGTKPFPEA